MRIQFGTLLADIGLIDLPKKYQAEEKKKEKLVSWFSDKSQPFNMYAHHSSIVKIRTIWLLMLLVPCRVFFLFHNLYPNVAATKQDIAGPALTNLGKSSTSVKGHPIWLKPTKYFCEILRSSLPSLFYSLVAPSMFSTRLDRSI
ncbi:hypothetical protein Pint_32993 [Pistacia integerrima]|uniref:Uncharacterized protein n=1 Tax=Pistacia integerrima TaxID=434235 RepID=A0ACC0X6R3_9ROSI|nr:hypothetical protein Pint_32993 [Pistacia integerrima]